MSFLAFILIFASAVTHVLWNLIAKKDHMSMGFYACLCTFGALAWCHVQFWTPVEIWKLPVTFWLCMAGVVASEFLYCCGLTLTYRKLDMVTAYPLVRAFPILLTALITSLTGLGTHLSWQACTGFAVVFAGVLLIPLAKLSDFSLRQYCRTSTLLVLMAAGGTTGYTVLDSLAQQILRENAGPEIVSTVISMSYYSTRSITLASCMWCATLCFRSGREVIRQIWRDRNWHVIVAGICGSSTYVLVLVAMNFVTNVAYVQTFRQLGLPVGMLGGVLILKEKSAPVKWVGVALILSGLAFSVQ